MQQHQQRPEREAYQANRCNKMDANGLPQGAQAASAFTPVSLDTILRNMNSRKAKEQHEAVRAVGLLITSAPDQLLLLAKMEAQNYQRHAASGAIISLAIVALVGMACVLLSKSNIWAIDNALYIFAGTCIALACWLSLYLPRRARRNMIDVYHYLDDPRFIGLALNMLVPDGITESRQSPMYTGYVQASMVGALTKMLKRVNVSHKTLLTCEQMQILLSVLQHSRTDRALTLAILRALQQIGDESAIPIVERIARSTFDVHSEAEECLEYLRGQADQKRQAQTLLRASDSVVSTRPEHMLRPANPETDAAPEQLLRPS